MRFTFNLRPFAVAAVFATLWAAAPAGAEVPFSQILTPAERASTGFTHLTPKQATALDALIQRDIDYARQGDVVAFAKSFTERRTTEERQRAGIDLLTEPERAQLDRLVATAIAARPVIPFYAPGQTHASGEVKVTPPKAEVHGQVSLFYGQSSGGGSFYGGSFDAVVIDPSKKLAIGVGMSTVRGRGLRGCYDEPIW